MSAIYPVKSAETGATVFFCSGKPGFELPGDVKVFKGDREAKKAADAYEASQAGEAIVVMIHSLVGGEASEKGLAATRKALTTEAKIELYRMIAADPALIGQLRQRS